ncbi:MAG: PH domain-containing protein [Bryobacteraceae bacterium]
MPELIVRPTAKFIKAGAILAAIAFLAVEIAYQVLWRPNEALTWVPIAAPLVLLWPAQRWLRRHFTKAVVGSDRLRYEIGMTSRSTRNIQLSKIQDVRVDQRLVQRLWKVGDLSIETAGEASRLTIRNVDDPQTLADDIMNRAQRGSAGI